MVERLKKVSPRPCRKKVNDFFFKKMGGYVQVGTVLAYPQTRPKKKRKKLQKKLDTLRFPANLYP